MKKLFLTLAVVFSVFILTSCGGKKSPVDETIAIIENAIEDVQYADTYEEFKAIGESAGEKINAIDAKYPDYEPTAKEEQALQKAMLKFMEACSEREAELGGLSY